MCTGGHLGGVGQDRRALSGDGRSEPELSAALHADRAFSYNFGRVSPLPWPA